MKASLFLIAALLAMGGIAKGQALAYEGFDYFNAASANLHQANNGKFTGATVSNWDKSLGWGSDWQEDPAKTIAAQIGTSASATYLRGGYDLITSGHYAVSGNTSIGRKLQNSPAGPFGSNGTNTSTTNTGNGTNFLAASGYSADTYGSASTAIGANARTLWLSFLLLKNEANDNAAYLSLHRNAALHDGNTGNHIAVGYFGAASNDGTGIRYWSLRINGTVTRSTVPVTLLDWTLLVARIDFNAAGQNTVTLYVNPANIGQAAVPTGPNAPLVAQSATGQNNRFRNAAYYGGGVASGPQSGIDEIRLAANYQSATTASDLIRVEGAVCGGVLGDNIFNNGDFNAYASTPTYNTATNAPWSNAAAVRSVNNSGPWTDVTGGAYCYVPDINTVGGGGPADGSYTIVDGIRNAYGIWVTKSDFSGTGFAMLANAAFQPGVFFTQTQSSFCKQTTYEFSVQVMNVDENRLLTAYGSSGTNEQGFQACDPSREPGCEQLSQLLGSTSGTGPFAPSTGLNFHQQSATTTKDCTDPNNYNVFDWYTSGTAGTTTGAKRYRVLPDIEFIIADALGGNQVVAYSPPAPIPNDEKWHKIGFTFTTKSVTGLTLKIRNKAPGGGGNDIALDNFSFRPCGPVIGMGNNFPGCNPVPKITSTVGNEYPTPQYLWQKSTNSGGTWTDIAGETASSYIPTFPTVKQGDWVRLKVANSTANFSDIKCHLVSGPQVVVCAIPLPVQLVSFRARKTDAGVRLDWQTASEKNSGYFTVQRSTDGVNFTTETCTVPAAGNSASLLSYHCTDNFPAPGSNYYRLRQTDADGTAAYSPIVSVAYALGEGGDISLFPNPARDAVTIRFANSLDNEQKVAVRVLTLAGRTVWQENGASPARDIEINTSHLADGLYMVEIITSQRKFVRKLVVSK